MIRINELVIKANTARKLETHYSMIKYLAFLRGINVGGQRIIKMNDLKQVFLSMGLTVVQTYTQSGNVSFNAESDNPDLIKDTIESQLHEKLGYHVNVMIRMYDYINHIVKSDPFVNYSSDNKIKLYICFLEKEPQIRPQLPLKNEKEGLELIRLDKLEAYISSKRVNGRFGFPNNFIEKEFNVISTARNWTTLSKIILND
jgi:uncharacterized protein (DUF1697 family)